MRNATPLASLSLDLDNHWAYLKTRGDSAWTKFPSYLERLIPRVLESVDEFGLKITFFVVGQDATIPKHRPVLAEIVKKGHDIGNHSFLHEPWLASQPIEAIREEIKTAERAILEATGRKPVGFRGPGFSWSPEIMKILVERDYLYDASTLPTYLGPMARLYYFAKSSLGAEGKKRRRNLFGGSRDGLRPIKPYAWLLPSGKHILEIPVTTMPVFKLPFHLSYLVYLSRFSPGLASEYLEISVRLCRLFKTGMSFLLHPLDFLGPDEASGLAFFPGMDVGLRDKLKLFRKVIRRISESFRLIDMRTHAEFLLNLRERTALHPLPLRRRSPKPSGDVS